MTTTTPLRIPHHKTTSSRQTLDTLPSNTYSTPPSSRPSTASSQTSFQSALSSHEAPLFRYYLPHISTPTSPIYAKNETHACNIPSPQSGYTIGEVGRFYQYVPGASTEAEDVYAEEDTIFAAGEVDVAVEERDTPELKVLGSLGEFVVTCTDPPTPVEVKIPLQVIGLDDFPYWPVECGVEKGDVDLVSYTAGEVLGSSEGLGDVETGKQRVARSGVDLARNMRRMLRKLRLGKHGR